ncbi:MAG: hypothetical protein ACOYLE_09140 [Bacteroidales bacterium]
MENNKLMTIKKNDFSKKAKRENDDLWQINLLITQFEKESDRAAVILIASIIDENLANLLKSFFVPIPNSDDSLIDNATSPLSTFSSKIDIAYRTGLISGKFARDLHIIRKIRNSFAHDIYECNFENGSVKSRIKELEKSIKKSKTINEIKRPDKLLHGPRGMFLYISSMLIYQISFLTKNVTELKEANREFFYIDNTDSDFEEIK